MIEYFKNLKARAQAIPPQDMPLTGLVVTILIICLGIYDLITVVVKGTGSSVSDFLIRTGFSSPMVVFTFGFVSGHLFGRMYNVGHPDLTNWWYVICAVLFGAFVGYGVSQWRKKSEN